MAELVDARDLKSLGPKGLYGFDSRSEYYILFLELINILYKKAYSNFNFINLYIIKVLAYKSQDGHEKVKDGIDLA